MTTEDDQPIKSGQEEPKDPEEDDEEGDAEEGDNGGE